MRNGKKVKLEKLFTNLPTPHPQLINPDGLLQQKSIQEDWIKELQESEYFYQDLVEHSHDLICVHDLKGKILYVNQGAAELFGYDKSSNLLKNLKDFLVPEVRHEFETYLSTIQRDGMAKGLMLVQTGTGEKRF
jgi:PAS domain-containing protein